MNKIQGDSSGHDEIVLNITDFAKSIIYLIAFSILSWLSVAMHTNFHASPDLQSVLFRCMLYMLMSSVCILGIGVFAIINYKRNDLTEHKNDGIFLTITGLIFLILAIIVFLGYGGISSDNTYDLLVAANFCVLLISFLPLPFCIKATHSAVRSSNHNKLARKVLITTCILAIIVYVLLVVFGFLLRLL